MKKEEQESLFDQWLEKHRGLLFKVVRAYAFNEHDREDLFQEIATQVWNSIPRYRRESKASTWIYRVALYSAIGWSKNENKRQSRHRSLALSQPLLEIRSTPRNPRLEWLYDQIARLRPVDRSLTLMMLDGYSYKEISNTLGMTESNVGVKLNRIKKQLNQNLEEDTDHEL